MTFMTSVLLKLYMLLLYLFGRGMRTWDPSTRVLDVNCLYLKSFNILNVKFWVEMWVI